MTHLASVLKRHFLGIFNPLRPFNRIKSSRFDIGDFVTVITEDEDTITFINGIIKGKVIENEAFNYPYNQDWTYYIQCLNDGEWVYLWCHEDELRQAYI